MVRVVVDQGKLEDFWYSTMLGRGLRALAWIPIALIGMLLSYPFTWVSAQVFNIDASLPVFIWIPLWFLPSLIYCAAVGICAVMTFSADHAFSFAAVLWSAFRAKGMVVDRLMSGYMVGDDGELYIREQRYIDRGLASEPNPDAFFELAYRDGSLVSGLLDFGYIGGGLAAAALAFAIGWILRQSIMNPVSPVSSPIALNHDPAPVYSSQRHNWPD